MKKFTKVLVIVLILAAVAYGIYFFFARDVVLGVTSGSSAPYQLVAGTGYGTSTAGSIYLATSSEPIVRIIHVGTASDQVTLITSVLASSTATTFRIYPELSRDCIDFYPWGGVPTSTVLLATTSFYTLGLPSNANTATSTASWTFKDINTECMKFKIYRGENADTTKDNGLIYSEVLLDK